MSRSSRWWSTLSLHAPVAFGSLLWGIGAFARYWPAAFTRMVVARLPHPDRVALLRSPAYRAAYAPMTAEATRTGAGGCVLDYRLQSSPWGSTWPISQVRCTFGMGMLTDSCRNRTPIGSPHGSPTRSCTLSRVRTPSDPGPRRGHPPGVFAVTRSGVREVAGIRSRRGASIRPNVTNPTRRPASRGSSARGMPSDASVVWLLAKSLDGVATELGELVQERDTMVGERSHLGSTMWVGLGNGANMLQTLRDPALD
jgi:hypothetical protein